MEYYPQHVRLNEGNHIENTTLLVYWRYMSNPNWLYSKSPGIPKSNERCWNQSGYYIYGAQKAPKLDKLGLSYDKISFFTINSVCHKKLSSF